MFFYFFEPTQGLTESYRSPEIWVLTPPWQAAIEDLSKDPEEESVENYAKNYYLIAHALGEKITQQPTLMVNGQLKDYQVWFLHHVCDGDRVSRGTY